ncbi:MAG: trigger factor [Flavobacteriales bacterium]|nr:trigger factor [Flavobacteriales bacterium]
MNVSQTSLDDLRIELAVTLAPEDYAPRVERSLKRHQKNAQMPGFRKGKVPMQLIKRQYGQSVLAEELNQMLSEQLQSHIQENNLNVLGNPIPSQDKEDSGDWNNPDTFTFHYELGLAPALDLDFGKKAKFTRHKIKVDKKAIDNQVADLQRRHGKMSDPDQSADTDMLIGAFAQLDADGAVLDGGITSDSTISVEFVEDKKTKKALVGLEPGSEVTVDPHKVSRGHDDLGRMLGISQEQVHDLKCDFKFTVKEVKRLEPHDVNQALFDKIYGEGVVTDEKAFRERVTEDLDGHFDRDAEWVFRRRFVLDLMDHIKMDLPDTFLKRWIMLTNENPLTPEQVEEEYPGYAESLRWQILQQTVAEAIDLKVTAEELEGEAKRMVGAQYAQYGMPMDEETLTNVAKNVLNDEKERRRIADVLVERKVVDDLKTRVKISEKQVSYVEFSKLADEVR